MYILKGSRATDLLPSNCHSLFDLSFIVDTLSALQLLGYIMAKKRIVVLSKGRLKWKYMLYSIGLIKW